ncbi:MAG: Protease-associated, partial [Acidobacteria bacterium]|nr:Protease-associated [Acidobacteriota bacterium]
IRARFNGNIGTTNCLERSKWYYGLDAQHGRDTDLVVVLLHEFAHGLGIIGGITINDPAGTPGPTDPLTGSFRSNKPFIYDLHALDNVTGLRMDQMSDAQRAAAVTADGKVVWDGDAVRPAAENLLLSVPRLTITAASGTSSFEVAQASFGAGVKASGVTAPIIVANDAVEPQSGSTAAGTTLDGCSSYSNAAAVAGNFAIVNEGRCTDVEKAKRAQEAGAIGLLIAAKTVTTNIYTPIGFEPSITIPVLGLFKNDGDAVRAAGTVTGSAFPDLTKLAGADTNGHVKLYVPVTAEPGSTYSHFDKTATPNLLMEPSINSDLTHSTDLTLSMLLDIGWGLVITPPAPVITGRRFLRR